MTGDISAMGDLQVHGNIQGDVRCAALEIGPTGVIEGNVVADEATVAGHVRGSIQARRVALTATARVEGDIRYEVFSKEDGAYFKGRPLRQEARASADPEPDQDRRHASAVQGRRARADV